jgi:Uma2 family endonuclease
MTAAERFTLPPEQFLNGRWRVPRFTRRDTEDLVRLGIIPEDASTELLDGLVVLKDRAATGEDPFMIGKDHVKAVERLSDLRTRINDGRRHVRSQQPLVCSETHVPEPDFAVIRGTLDDYADLPAATDAFSVIEVADASYERDSGEKLAGYARAGVALYIVLNLRNRTAEVYTAPNTSAGAYGSRQIVVEGQSLVLRVGEDEFFPVALSEILP